MSEMFKFEIFVAVIAVSFIFGFVINGFFIAMRRARLMTLAKKVNLTKWIEMNGPQGILVPSYQYERSDEDYENEEIRVLKSQIRKGVILNYLVFPWVVFVGLVFHFCFGLFNGWKLN